MKHILFIIFVICSFKTSAISLISDRQKQVITLCADYMRKVRDKKCPKHIWISIRGEGGICTDAIVNPDPRCSLELEACKDMLNVFKPNYSTNKICGYFSCRDPYVYDACRQMCKDVGNIEDFDERYTNVFAGTIRCDTSTTKYCFKNGSIKAKGVTYAELFDQNKLRGIAHEILNEDELEKRKLEHEKVVQELAMRNPKYTIYTSDLDRLSSEIATDIKIFAMETLPRFMSDFSRALASNLSNLIKSSNMYLGGKPMLDSEVEKQMINNIDQYGQGHTFAGLVDFWFTVRPKEDKYAVIDHLLREEMEIRREELKKFGLVDNDKPIGHIHLDKEGNLKK